MKTFTVCYHWIGEGRIKEIQLESDSVNHLVQKFYQDYWYVEITDIVKPDGSHVPPEYIIHLNERYL